MDEHIYYDWGYTKSHSIKKGWDLFWYCLKYAYPRGLKNPVGFNCTGKPLVQVYQEEFWLLLSGYEADF